MCPMDRANKANQRIAAIHNRRTTIQLLQKHQALSRRQLSQMTGLRGSTLTYIVREMLEKQIVRQAGKRASQSAGKKQVMLEINPQLGWALGIGLEKDLAHLVLVNAGGGLVDGQRLELKHDLPAALTIIKAFVGQWLHQRGNLEGRMLGVGVGLPGVVDAAHGQVLYSSPFQASDYPLQMELAQAFGTLATVDNDAACAALAEARLGDARDLQHFVYFLVACEKRAPRVEIHSYGTSLFLKGEAYRGVHFGAGEITPTLQPDKQGLHISVDSLKTLEQSDGALNDELQAFADKLGMAIAPVVNLMDPQAVVLGGDIVWRNQRMLAAIKKSMNQQLVNVPQRQVQLLTSRFEDNGTAIGAALFAIDQALIGPHGVFCDDVSDGSPNP